MSPEQAKILIVEDSPTMALTYKQYLSDSGLKITIAETGEAALENIASDKPNIILLDLKLPDMSGLDILKQLKGNKNPAEVIVITAHGSVTTAVEAMREGAIDFLLKPLSKERLTTTVKNTLHLLQLKGFVEKITGQKPRKFDKFIGDSPAMQAVYRMLEDSAPSRASVFIMGPSGTGKELCAETIHQLSPRKNQNFVALNCAAIPANLIESEIFGHKKGAFTGAVADREGAAIRADGGTLFLDEICEMPLELQAKLLRFIQTGQVVPVGSNEPLQVNVRFVCATNRIPWKEVEAGRFREDLYYRLHVVPIHVPPLRNRGTDILLIARYLLDIYSTEENKQFTSISPEAESRLLAHSWPGNVRELSNVIQSAIVLNEGPVLEAGMLEPLIGPVPSTRQLSSNHPQTESVPNGFSGVLPPVTKDTEIEPLAVSERRLIEQAIEACGGRVRAAAKRLEVNPSTLYRKIKEWG